GGHHPLATVVQGHAGKAHDTVLDRSRNADFFQVVSVQAGKHGDGEGHQVQTCVGCFNRSQQHSASAGAMHSEHADSELGRFGNRCPNRVGNIVVFQVEKDPP